MTAIVVFVALLILFVLIWTVVRRPKTNAEEVLHLNFRQREIDIGVLTLLLSSDENEYLRRSLPAEQFRRVRRGRLALARKYLRAIKAHTGEFIRAAEEVKLSSDPELAQAAQELLLVAFRVRLNVPIVQMCVMVEWLFPSLSLVAAGKVDRYREMGKSMTLIVDRLQDGAPRRISAG